MPDFFCCWIKLSYLINLNLYYFLQNFPSLSIQFWSSIDFVSSLLFSQSLMDLPLTNFWFCLINKNCTKMNDLIAATSVRSSCSSVWRFEILSGDGAVREVFCITEKKGSELWGGSIIDLVSVVKNEFAPLNVLLTNLPSSSSCKIICCKYCTESSFRFFSLTRKLWLLFKSGRLLT